MEEGVYKKFGKLKIIAVTGPESTGKTVISEYLAKQLNCDWIPEYAREYIGKLQRPYTYDDLLHIASTQIERRKMAEQSGKEYLILDTWLIITRVWFLEVYGNCPDWIEEELMADIVDLYLLCEPDIPWVPDPLRENGGEKRNYLMKRYLEEIQAIPAKFCKIGGSGELRLLNATAAVHNHFSRK